MRSSRGVCAGSPRSPMSSPTRPTRRRCSRCARRCAMRPSSSLRCSWTSPGSTTCATRSGFSRGRYPQEAVPNPDAAGRFAVVYNLMSIAHNQRLRLRVKCPDSVEPSVDSVIDVWASANWFEREAFDLFGIIFRGHPDLRRILTDYGFIGHPFRKDFPLIGNVEVQYDPDKQRVVYRPVSITPRVLVPKVIRHDHRYEPALRDPQVPR